MGNSNDMSSRIRSLKKKLRALMLLESSKPYKEMDSDLVAECVDFLMEAKGRKKLTEEEIKERVEKIPFDNQAIEDFFARRRKIGLRALAVIAAILILLCAIFISPSADTDDAVDRWEQAYGDFGRDQFLQKGYARFGNADYYVTEVHRYFLIDEMVKSEGYPMLYPEWLPEGDKITHMSFDDTGIDKYYRINFTGTNHGITVHIGKHIPEEPEMCSKAEINGFTVYYFPFEENIEATFNYGNSICYVTSDSEENIIKIIENLKEIK